MVVTNSYRKSDSGKGSECVHSCGCEISIILKVVIFSFFKQFYLPWRGIGFLQYSSPFSHNLTLIHLFFENIVRVCGPTLAILYYFDYIIKWCIPVSSVWNQNYRSDESMRMGWEYMMFCHNWTQYYIEIENYLATRTTGFEENRRLQSIWATMIFET